MARDHKPIRLILSDIDGTMLPFGHKVVNDRTQAAMRAAIRAGIRTGPASGRGRQGVMPAFGGAEDLCATMLATNGMQVYLDGELICEKTLPHEILGRVVELSANEEGAGTIIFDANGVPLLVAGTREDLAPTFPAYAAQAVDFDGVPDFAVVKCNVFVSGGLERTQELLDLYRREIPEVDYNLPMAGFLNLCPRGWSKASGIEVLAERLGIGMDQVVTFGDSGNDIEMLAAVPNSVAVANATEEARNAAHWHIGPCEDDAVAAAIEALAAGEWPFTR